MSNKTTSTTVCVGDWTYIFLNKPDTKYIDFIRFKDPKSPVKGVIGTGPDAPIVCSPGPLSALEFGFENQAERSIRLYFIGDQTVREVKLENAHDGATNPKTGWVFGTKGSADLKFENAFSKGTRGVDSSSFLSASSRLIPSSNIRYPVVVYKAAGEDDFLNYTFFDADNAWKLQRLDIPDD